MVLAGRLCGEPAAATQDFQIPGHGTLRLAVPDGWKVNSRPLREPASVTLHLSPNSGDRFDIQISAVWLSADQLAKTSGQSLRENMQRAANDLLSHSVEKVATIQEIRGAESIVDSFALTDRDPGPGEYKYLTQGTFLAGEALSAFTILYRAPQTPEVAEAIRMFREAMYIK
jgi:hypothetical protein